MSAKQVISRPIMFASLNSYFRPICDTLNFPISLMDFLSPPAGWFESVNVEMSVFGGKTSDSWLKLAMDVKIESS